MTVIPSKHFNVFWLGCLHLTGFLQRGSHSCGGGGTQTGPQGGGHLGWHFGGHGASHGGGQHAGFGAHFGGHGIAQGDGQDSSQETGLADTCSHGLQGLHPLAYC